MADIASLKKIFLGELETAASVAELQNLRVKYLGRKGLITEELKALPKLSVEEKKIMGKSLNELKDYIESEISSKEKILSKKDLNKRLVSESIDITLPGKSHSFGREHPITKVLNEISDIFVQMGFSVEEGPEVELDYYNFEALNFPKNHPARDMQDTFFVTDDVILRTHTSPVQVRVMEKKKPPLRFIAPGKVYRCDADVSHTPMFHQVEGMMVDTDVSFSDLKGVLELFIHRMFGPEVPLRFRPSFFPFTEPSAEIDMGCILCKGKGCSVCKNSGWLEILGAGMVNPRVFEMVGYDSEIYTGFAFGMGVERIAMLKYSIDDIRLFFENDIRFLRQF
ncbi:MAG: phenylalanine--tRNA ligase subunit alpha [Nitrospiraceae bacterium]|nr:phenylalanine--tRNA ligase subunit alpha [Nitrospiraceae bacterium]